MKLRNFLFIYAAVLSCTASISASSTHTWVSGSGSDSNPCTFASPCASFTGALANTAAGGIISAKDAGDFGNVIIGKSITIDGNNLGSISVDSGYGIYVIGGANVTVQNLVINGLGSGAGGISVINGGVTDIDNCKIINVSNYGIYFSDAGKLIVENSRIESLTGSSNVGININSNAAENIVIRNSVIDLSPYANNNIGLGINTGAGPVTASLQNVTIAGAGGGALFINSGLTQITGSVINQSSYGLYVANGATVSVASSLITANGYGVCSEASSKIRLDNNDIYDNTTAIGNCGGIVKTSGTNKTSGTISIPASDVSESVTF